jgi:hypothetical protein
MFVNRSVFAMETETPLHELVEGVRAIIAKDMNEEPVPHKKAVADPALWRAIQNQQRHGSEGQCWFAGAPEKP